MAVERRLYLERNCRLPESPAHSRRRNREGPASSQGLNSQRGFGPAVEPRRKSRPRSTSLHGSSPCKCQRLSTLRWDRLPPSRPSTKSGARAGGRRLSDRRLHRWLAGTSASAPSSHGAADLLGLNRAHICVRNRHDLALPKRKTELVPLRDRCSFGLFPWLISQALSVTYMAVERRLYLERNCRLPESPAHSRRRNREGPASSQGLNSQRGFGPAVEPRRKSRPRSTSLHGSSPCKCQRLSTLRWDRLPPSRPSTKSGARAGGRRLSDRRLHRWLAGTSASAPSSHGAADLLGLNRAHICVRNHRTISPMYRRFSARLGCGPWIQTRLCVLKSL